MGMQREKLYSDTKTFCPLIFCCYFISCMTVTTHTLNVSQASCVTRWVAIHEAVSHEDDQRGKVEFYVHIMDVITVCELQMVVVIFFKSPLFWMQNTSCESSFHAHTQAHSLICYICSHLWKYVSVQSPVIMVWAVFFLWWISTQFPP